jgi:hypothetical protein
LSLFVKVCQCYLLSPYATRGVFLKVINRRIYGQPEGGPVISASGIWNIFLSQNPNPQELLLVESLEINSQISDRLSLERSCSVTDTTALTVPEVDADYSDGDTAELASIGHELDDGTIDARLVQPQAYFRGLQDLH